MQYEFHDCMAREKESAELNIMVNEWSKSENVNRIICTYKS